MKNIKKISQPNDARVTEDEIVKMLSEIPANDNIYALSGFDEGPAVNDNDENVSFAEFGFANGKNATSLDDDKPLDATEEEIREELNFFDEGHQRRGFLAEESTIYED